MIPRSAPALVAVALLGCPPPAPPLDDVRERLVRVAAEPMEPGFPPQAGIVVGDPLVERVIVDALTARGMDEVRLDTPFGEVRATPRATAARVSLGEADCLDCLALDAAVEGDAQVTLGGTAYEVPWRTTAAGTLRVDGAPGPDGFAVSLVPVEPDAWEVDVDVAGLPPVPWTPDLAAPIALGTLPRDVPVAVRGLRVQAADGVAIGLGLGVLFAGEVAAWPDPGDGFAVVVPAPTLLGLVHAVLVADADGWQIEPTSLRLDDGGFDLVFRVWPPGRRARWTSYAVRGTVGLGEGAVSFRATSVDDVDREGLGTPLDPLVKRRVMQVLSDVSVPARLVRGGDAVVIERLEAEDDVLTVWGRLE